MAVTSPIWASVVVESVVDLASKKVASAISSGEEKTTSSDPIHELDHLNRELEQIRIELKGSPSSPDW